MIRKFIRKASPRGRDKAVISKEDTPNLPPPLAATGSVSVVDKHRHSSFVNISKRSDVNTIFSSREAFTSDMEVFDFYVKKLRDGVNRSAEDSSFNDSLWSHVRACLQHANPVGFKELAAAGSCHLMTNDHVMAVITKSTEFRHLMPINPNLLAEKSGVPLQDVLTELFYATSVGMVDMVFSPECMRCGGCVCQETSITDIPSEANCVGCGIRNEITNLDAVKVCFVFNPQIFYLPVRHLECPHSSQKMQSQTFIGCAFPTATKSGFSYDFGTGTKESHPMLQKKLYRMVCAYSGIDCYLKVEADATENDKNIEKELMVSDLVPPEMGAKHLEVSIPHGKVRLDFFCDTHSTMVLFLLHVVDDDTAFYLPENERTPYASATDCVHHPSFKKMFESQIVSDHSSFTVQRVVLVFTDVVGSTALYEACGDGAALETVKQHFKVLFTAVAKSGRVVKTVGDCVMAAFTSGEDAIRAVSKGLNDMQTRCLLPNGEPLSIRVGMHAGPALMLSLNGINDYFGSTVNVAARVESKATAHECLVTESVLSCDNAAAAFEEITSKGTFKHSRDVELSLKGVDGLVRAKGFQVKSAAK